MPIDEGQMDLLCNKLQTKGRARLSERTPDAEGILRACSARIGVPDTRIEVTRAGGIITLTIRDQT